MLKELISLLYFIRDCIFPPSDNMTASFHFKTHLPKPLLKVRRKKRSVLSILPLSDSIAFQSLHAFKYEHSFDGRDGFAVMLNWAITRLILVHSRDLGYPIVCFVPARPERVYDIGYDQGRFILDRLRHINRTIIISQLLTRKRNIVQQALISDERERIENAHMTFSLIEEYKETINNKWIIIIDDVCTTGATLRDAERALKKGNPKEVTLLSLMG